MCPSGNSNASWCVRGSLLLICRKMAVVCSIVFTFKPNKPIRALRNSLSKASSVPGRTQTAVRASSGAANPRVPVLKLRVTSQSPTLAGRDFAVCKL